MNYSRLDLLPPFSADAMIRGLLSFSTSHRGGGRENWNLLSGREEGREHVWAKRRRRKRDDLIVSRGGRRRERERSRRE